MSVVAPSFRPDGHVELFLASVPPSLNVYAFRSSGRSAHRLKRQWQNDVGMLLMAERLPRHLDRVFATATLRFSTKRGRDEGNFRVLLEKVVGDALVEGRYLPDDTPEHYGFGAVTFEGDSGPARTLIRLDYSELKEHT